LERSKQSSLPLSLIYPFPAPETIGISLASDSETQIRSVLPESAAAKSGLQAGDELVRVQGQPLMSSADFSWVLHHTPETATLEVIFRRGTQERTVQVPLSADWRQHADISRRVGTWQMRAMALGGLLLEDATEADRSAKGLKPDQLALVAKHVGEYGEHAAAKKAGFKKGDLLIEIAGNARRASESEVIGRLLRQFKPRDLIQVTVLRDDTRLELSYPIQ
jgi:S1-C subfamily serine protease